MCVCVLLEEQNKSYVSKKLPLECENLIKKLHFYRFFSLFMFALATLMNQIPTALNVCIKLNELNK